MGTGRRAHLQDPSGVRGRLGRGVSLRRRGHRRVRVRLGHGARGRGRGERHDRRSPRTVRRTVSSAPSSRTGFRGCACRGRAAAPARPSGRLPGRPLACLPLDAARHPPEVATRATQCPGSRSKLHLAVSRSRAPMLFRKRAANLPFRVVASIRQKVGAPSERNTLKKHPNVDARRRERVWSPHHNRSRACRAALSHSLLCFGIFLHAWSNGEGATKERVFSSSAPLFRFFFPQ